MSSEAQWHSLPDHISRVFQGCSLCGCICLSIVVDPWLLLAHQLLGLILRLTGYEGCLWLQQMFFCAGPDITDWELLYWGSSKNWVHSSCVSFVRLVGWCCGIVLRQTRGMLVLKPLERGFGMEQVEPVLVPSLGPSSRTYKVISS